MAEEVEVGRVNDYFAHINVAGIDLTAPLKVGDRIRIKGHTTDMELVVESLQVEHESVEEAKAGDKIGVKVSDRVRSKFTLNQSPTSSVSTTTNAFTTRMNSPSVMIWSGHVRKIRIGRKIARTTTKIAGATRYPSVP